MLVVKTVHKIAKIVQFVSKLKNVLVLLQKKNLTVGTIKLVIVAMEIMKIAKHHYVNS